MNRFAFCAALAILAAGCSGDPPENGGEHPASEDARRQPASPQPPTVVPDPIYTSLATCALVRSVPEEGGFYEHECAGVRGYRLRKVESDLRDNIVVLAPDGGEHSLGLPALANGAFSSVGDTVEWLGATGTAEPQALILRHSVMEDPDPTVPEVSYLVVARLAPRPCVIARIAPGPGQNRQARQAADGAGACLSPRG